MTQDKSREASEAGERAGSSEDERQERLTQLERFPAIFAEHRDYVEDLLRKRGVESHEVKDLLQEVFVTLHAQILEIGVVDSIPAMLHTLTHHKILNHVHAQQRAPFTHLPPIGGGSARTSRAVPPHPLPPMGFPRDELGACAVGA